MTHTGMIIVAIVVLNVAFAGLLYALGCRKERRDAQAAALRAARMQRYSMAELRGTRKTA